MKPKLVVLVTVLLLLAMVPALAMAGKGKPSATGKVQIDIRQPIGPQLDAQLGVGAKGPRAAGPVNLAPSRGGVQPNAVYGLLNDGFEGGADPGWLYYELGFSSVGWDATDIESKRGAWSFYSAAWDNDEYTNPYYDNDMYSWAVYPMDLQGAKRVQWRFQHKTDTEYFFDEFLWCASADGNLFDCYYYTGSTNDKWRLVQLDSRNDPILKGVLGSPDAAFGLLFWSDFSIVDRGTFVDAMRIRAWGP